MRPAVWRRLEVPSAITLGWLHQVLQAAFDRGGDHLQEFEVCGIRYAPDREDLYGPTLSDSADRDEDVTALGRVAPRPGDVVDDDTYDIGDDRRHRLEVESVGRAAGCSRVA